MQSLKQPKLLFYALTFLMLFSLALTGCSAPEQSQPTPTPLIPPTQTPAQVPEPTATPLQAAPIGTPPDWDDRSVYSTGLIPEAQYLLRENPKATVYYITLDIPSELPAPLTGTLMVRYFNQENTPLEEIYFRQFAYIYSGQLETKDVQVDGIAVETQLESDKTALKVILPTPLPVDESVVVAMRFTLQLPFSLTSSYGLLGYFDEILSLDTFYPMIPAYDEQGWYTHTPYHNGDPTYQDISYYQVEVRAPADFVLVSSGVEIEHTVEDETQTILFAAGPVRDFYLSGSRGFKINSKVVNGITINSYAQPDQRKGQTAALDAAGHALTIFSELFGPYPYTEFDIVNAPMLALGVEYPGITNIYNKLYDTEGTESGEAILKVLEMVIAHEVGHQWFYNMVGSDQQDAPWLDESVTQYITYLYTYNQYGEKAAQSNINNWESRLNATEDRDKPIGLPADSYQGAEYSGIVYGRGPLFFLNLQKTYGQEVVIAGLRDYFQDNIWQHGEDEDLLNSLQAACDCDLTRKFEQYVYPP